jgi:hypothetical protein
MYIASGRAPSISGRTATSMAGRRAEQDGLRRHSGSPQGRANRTTDVGMTHAVHITVVRDDPIRGGYVKQIQQRKFDSLIRAEDFFVQHATLIGNVAQSAAKRLIDDTVAQLREHITAQGATARVVAGQTGRIHGMAKELVANHISPITKFARANLKGITDYETLTKTPRSAAPKKLVTHAYAIAKSAAPYATAMTEAGFPDDTVDQLLEATNELNDAIIKREPMRTDKVRATESIETLLQQGRDAVRKIDAVLAKRLVAEGPALAAWRSSSRVDGKPGAVRQSAVRAPVIAPERATVVQPPALSTPMSPSVTT